LALGTAPSVSAPLNELGDLSSLSVVRSLLGIPTESRPASIGKGCLEFELGLITVWLERGLEKFFEFSREHQ
jgi:hypothetical protein